MYDRPPPFHASSPSTSPFHAPSTTTSPLTNTSGSSPGDRKLSKPEAKRLLQATVAANGVGGSSGASSSRKGEKSARGGKTTPRGSGRKGGQQPSGPIMVRVSGKAGEGPSLLQLQREYESELRQQEATQVSNPFCIITSRA